MRQRAQRCRSGLRRPAGMRVGSGGHQTLPLEPLERPRVEGNTPGLRMPPREEGEPIMRHLVIVFSAVAVLAGHAAFAVSDGQYLPANQNCTGNAYNSYVGTRTEAACHKRIAIVADCTGLQYAGWGLNLTPDGTEVHCGEV